MRRHTTDRPSAITVDPPGCFCVGCQVGLSIPAQLLTPEQLEMIRHDLVELEDRTNWRDLYVEEWIAAVERARANPESW